MARRTLLDDLIEMPWWFSLVLAFIIYVGIKFILPAIEFESPIYSAIAKGLAPLPNFSTLVLVSTAMASAFHSWRKGELFEKQTSVKTIKDLSWKDFEYLVSEVYRRQGYSVQENSGAGADGGIDLTLFDGGTKILVQCKNWRTSKVGVSVVREMLGLVTAESAQRGVVICSGYFTKEAQKFAYNNAIELVDGNSLSRMISKIKNDPKKLTPTPVSQVKSRSVQKLPLQLNAPHVVAQW